MWIKTNKLTFKEISKQGHSTLLETKPSEGTILGKLIQWPSSLSPVTSRAGTSGHVIPGKCLRAGRVVALEHAVAMRNVERGKNL